MVALCASQHSWHQIWGRLLVARRTAFLNGSQLIAGFDLLLH
jgi:hypothetical protein